MIFSGAVNNLGAGLAPTRPGCITRSPINIQLKSSCRLQSWNERNKMQKETFSIPNARIKSPERPKSDIFPLISGGGGKGGS